MVIGVWRPVVIKEALKQLPQEIKVTLTPGQLAAYEKLYGRKDDIYEQHAPQATG